MESIKLSKPCEWSYAQQNCFVLFLAPVAAVVEVMADGQEHQWKVAYGDAVSEHKDPEKA